MTPPRQIYVGSLSRKERAWGRPRRGPGIRLILTRVAGATSVAAGASLVLPRIVG